MALLSVGGIPISNTVYAASAIILLPINSSINPIVYSGAIDRIFQKFKKSQIVNKFTFARMWSFSQRSQYKTVNPYSNNQTSEASLSGSNSKSKCTKL